MILVAWYRSHISQEVLSSILHAPVWVHITPLLNLGIVTQVFNLSMCVQDRTWGGVLDLNDRSGSLILLLAFNLTNLSFSGLVTFAS